MRLKRRFYGPKRLLGPKKEVKISHLEVWGVKIWGFRGFSSVFSEKGGIYVIQGFSNKSVYWTLEEIAT